MDGVLWTTGNKNTIWNKLFKFSDANSASYVEENDLADVFANRGTDEDVEISGNDMQAASLKLTNGVSEAFAEAGVDADDDQVGDIVNLLLSVFVALTSGDISSFMDCIKRSYRNGCRFNWWWRPSVCTARI